MIVSLLAEPIAEPVAELLVGNRGYSAAAATGWVWQDGSGHDWQDGSDAEWQEGEPPAPSTDGNIQWPSDPGGGTDVAWPDSGGSDGVEWPDGDAVVASSRDGHNLNHTSYWSSSQIYKDVAKLGTFYRNNTTGGTISESTGLPLTGSTSWVVQTFAGNKLSTGTYNITKSGSGTGPDTMVVSGGDGQKVLNYNGAIDSFEVRLDGDVGTYTSTTATRSAAAGVLRFMNAWKTNDSEYDSDNPWIRVVVGATNTFYFRIMTPEDIIAMCEEYNCDAWITIHHLATAQNIQDIADAFVGFSKHLYVEHSNEVWNSGFPQHSYAKTQLAGYAGGETANIQAWHADRTDTIGEVFKTTLGSENVTVVWGSQNATVFFINTAIDFAQRNLDYIDAAAVAPYIGGPWAGSASRDLATVQAMTNQQIVDEAEDDFENRVKPLVTSWKSAADARGWRLLLYEFGSHLAAQTGHADEGDLNTEFIAASQSAEMGTLYETYFAWLKANVNDTMCLYRDVGTDAWGHWQYEQSSVSSRAQVYLDNL